MRVGVSDPIAFLDQTSDDLFIASVILQKAEELQRDHEDHMAQQTAIYFANALVRAFGGS